MRPSPIVRWAGSKRKLVSRLTQYWPPGADRYVEPFAGSAALFFALAPQRAILADLNKELITTYETIVNYPQAVYRAATEFGPSRKTYLAFRKTRPEMLGRIPRAARFLYLNRYCFNGLYRTDTNGRFNVPFAPRRSGQFPSWEAFRLAADALSRAHLLSCDFETVLRRHVRSGDFVYLDPPYAVANRRIFRQYDALTFGIDDLQRLADTLHSINALGARFLVSYAYCAEAKALFKDWDLKKVFVHRNISGFAKHRRAAAELLVSNCAEN